MVGTRLGSFRRGRLVGFVASLVLLTASGASRATPTWLHPDDLSAVGSVGHPQIALDAAGDAFAIWEHSGAVEAATRHAGGNWGAAQVISGGCGSASGSELAVNPTGMAMAVWTCSGSGNSVIQAALRPAGRAWSPAETLSVQGYDANAAQVALDPAGDATAVWKRNDGTTDRIQGDYRPVKGTWLPPVYISGGANYPQVAIDAGGNAVAVWQAFDGTAQAAQCSNAGTWSSPQVLSTGGTSWYPQVGVDSAGDAIAVWSRQDPSLVAQAATRPAGGTWGPPKNLSKPNDNAFGPQVAMAPGGAAVVVWVDAGAAFSIQASSQPAGGGWSAPRDVSDFSSHFGSYAVAIDPAGEALVDWSRQAGGVLAVEAARGRVGGTWTAPRTLSAENVDADQSDTALDAAGDGAAVWVRGGFEPVVQASGLDAAGPVVSRLKISGRRAARKRLAFSVSAIDAWSGLGDDPRWTFGDGSHKDGARVTHVYRRPGSYTVRLRLVDGSGNVSTVSRRLKIGRARN